MVPPGRVTSGGGTYTAASAGADQEHHGGLHRLLLHWQLHLLDGRIQIQKETWVRTF